MANFANLKAAINAVIKQNGQGEITGEVMNQVLTAMVNSLGSNYQFAGVATPSTNPGTPDQNVFYMATQAGTYTNFSAIVLQAGISILLWNGSWSSETFFTIDAVPTSGSNNFISSGAVFDKFKLDGGAYDVSAHNNNATFADLSAILNSENLNTLIPVAIRHGGMSIKFVQTSDNNNYVKFFCTADEFTTDVTKWQGVDDKPVVGNSNLVKSGGVRAAINQLESGTFDLFHIKGKYVNSNGSIGNTTADNAITDYLEIPEDVEKIIIRGRCDGVVALCAFYNANKVYIANSAVSGVPSNVDYVIEASNIPEGAKYIVANGFGLGNDSLLGIVNFRAIQNAITNSNSEIDKINKIIKTYPIESVIAGEGIGKGVLDAYDSAYDDSLLYVIRNYNTSVKRLIICTKNKSTGVVVNDNYFDTNSSTTIYSDGNYKIYKSGTFIIAVDWDLVPSINGWFGESNVILSKSIGNINNGLHIVFNQFRSNVNSSISELSTKIAENTSNIEDLQKLNYKIDDLTSTQQNGYWTYDQNDHTKAAYSSGTTLKTVTCNISAGDIILTSSIEEPAYAVLWPLLAEDNTIVQSLSNFKKLEITQAMIDAGAVKIGVCYRPSEQPASNPFYLKRMTPKVATKEDIYEETRIVNDLTNMAVPGYWNANNTPPGYSAPSGTDLRTATFDILEGDVIMTNFQEPPIYAIGCFLFDKNGYAVQRITSVFSTFVITKAMVDAGAVKMNVTYRTTQTEQFYLYRQRSKFEALEAEIQELRFNKKVILFGDSQIGVCRMENILAQLLGTTVYNFGFGGCRWTWRTNDCSSDWDAFTMLEVAKALTTGNFSVQDAALAEGTVIDPSEDGYFWTSLAAMKELYQSGDLGDGSDYIISIAYGGNDFFSSVPFGDENSESNRNIYGAMNQVFKILLEAYPALTICVVNPTFVLWGTNFFPDATIDTQAMTITYNGRTYPLYQHGQSYYLSADDYINTIGDVDYTRRTYGEKILEIARDKFKSQTYNMYTRGGRNAINIFTLCPDGVHPYSELGKKLTADKYKKIFESF